MQLWLQRPRAAPARRIVVKIHLLLALFLAVYIAVISVSGSAVVFRPQLNRWLTPRVVPQPDVERITEEALALRVADLYPDHTIALVRVYRRPGQAAYARLERDGVTMERVFDPYTGADLGDPYPVSLRAVEWLVDLHDNLLAGDMGRTVNGVGGALFGIVLLTGFVLWWPGTSRWTTGFWPGRPALTRAFLWRSHGVVGFYTLWLLAIWAVTAFYFAFPVVFDIVMDALDDDPEDFVRPGEALIIKAVDLHFGRYGGTPMRTAWTVLGLVPLFLAVSGVALWWTGRRARAKLPKVAKTAMADETVAVPATAAGAIAGSEVGPDAEIAPDRIYSVTLNT